MQEVYSVCRFFQRRRRHKRWNCDWSSDVCSSDLTYQVEPGLATKWEFRAPNTYRFTLRPNVMFHDGTPFTAKDVKATIDRMAGAGGGTVAVDEKSAVI